MWGHRVRPISNSTIIIPNDHTSTLGPDFTLSRNTKTSGAVYLGDLSEQYSDEYSKFCHEHFRFFTNVVTLKIARFYIYRFAYFLRFF